MARETHGKNNDNEIGQGVGIAEQTDDPCKWIEIPLRRGLGSTAKAVTRIVNANKTGTYLQMKLGLQSE